MHFVGLDIGTTGCRAAIFSATGALVSNASREYTVDIPQPSWAEQDAENVWRLTQDALVEAISTAQINRVAAVGLSVQGETVIPVDKQGRAIRPAVLGMPSSCGSSNMNPICGPEPIGSYCTKIS